MTADPGITALHAAVDEIMVRVKTQTARDGCPGTCSKGCSACCYEPVLVERREVSHALALLNPAQLARVKQRTRDWLDKVLPSGLLAVHLPKIWDWRPLRAACPFLEAGQCMVYDRRPAGCRYHLAIGPAANCFDEKLRLQQKFALCPQAEIIYMQTLTRQRRRIETAQLGVLLAELLLHRTIKSADAQLIPADAVNAAADEIETFQ